MIDDIDIDKIMVSNETSFGKKSFKYFVLYKDDEKFNPLCIMLPKRSRYTKSFIEPKYVSFLIKDNKWLEKYNKI